MAPEVESCYNPNKDIHFSPIPYKGLPTDGKNEKYLFILSF